MANGWTGGQYSIYRVLLGACLAVHFLAHPSLLHAAGAVGALLLLAGFHDRLGALIAGCVLVAAGPPHGFLAWAAVAHLLIPPDPYGAWWARHRPDPRGDWRYPPWLFAVAWVATSLGYARLGISGVDGTALRWLELVYAPLALFPRARPWIWLAMGLLLPTSPAPARVLLHLLTFDPGWIPGRWPERRDRVLYDGTCALCHGVVRFLLAEDRRGTAFVYAPLREGASADTVQVRTETGLLGRSAAVLYLLERLGGLWRVLAVLAGILPRALRDGAYDVVARHRYRVFGRKTIACPVLPQDLRSRFEIHGGSEHVGNR